MRGEKGGWIKVAKKTPHKAEMTRLAELMGVELPVAFLAWFEFYAWLDDVTEDGKLYGYNEFRLDGIAGHPGFAKAMQEVGWLYDMGDHWEVSKWGLYNGGTAKAKALHAERQRRLRDARSDAKSDA